MHEGRNVQVDDYLSAWVANYPGAGPPWVANYQTRAKAQVANYRCTCKALDEIAC